jgi:DNA-binding NarL/FixJ family response regulator
LIQTVLVDDHKLFAEGLERILIDTGHFEMVGKFYTGKSLLADIQHLSPQLLVSDVELGDLTGLDLIARVRLIHPEIKIVLLSMHEEPLFSNEALSLGADGYLVKSIEHARLVEALLQIAAGKKIFPPTRHTPLTQPSPLSEREMEILKLLAKGKTSGEIAQALTISDLTVKTHRRNMMRKLKVKNVAAMISKLMGLGHL